MFNFNDENQNTNEEVRALDFNDLITPTEINYIELKPGTYDFTVEDYRKERFNGSEKLPACWKVNVKFNISTPEGNAKVFKNYYLTNKTTGFITEFFVGIGLAVPGETFRMDWDKAIGKTGKCQIDNRIYEGNTYNEMKRILPPKVRKEAAENNSAGGFTPGRF